MQSPPRLPGSYLVVELTNRCSLACVHCSVAEEGHGHHQRTGYLDPLLFEALIDDLVAVGASFDTLILFWLGEPLLHPHWSLIWRHGLRAAARYGTFGKVEVHTNATHLTSARVKAALNGAAVPQVWHFSLDAATQATYTRVKGMDRFPKVVDQVGALLSEKARTGARWPRPVFQFIVGSNNHQEAAAFREYWEGVCRRNGLPVRAAAGHVPPGEDAIVFFRQLDCPTALEQERENRLFRDTMQAMGLAIPIEAKKGEAVEATNRSACSGFWKSPVVSWKGEVTTCTRDNLLENTVGSLTEAPFSALWWGSAMRGRRARVGEGDYSGLSLCETCFIPRSLNHADLSQQDRRLQSAHDQSLSTETGAAGP